MNVAPYRMILRVGGFRALRCRIDGLVLDLNAPGQLVKLASPNAPHPVLHDCAWPKDVASNAPGYAVAHVALHALLTSVSWCVHSSVPAWQPLLLTFLYVWLGHRRRALWSVCNSLFGFIVDPCMDTASDFQGLGPKVYISALQYRTNRQTHPNVVLPLKL